MKNNFFLDNKKMEFYRGIGSQQRCYDENPNDGFFVCYQDEYMKDGVAKATNLYQSFATFEDFEEATKSITPKCFYEQLTGEFCEIYDIDGKRSDPIYRDKDDFDIILEFVRARKKFAEAREAVYSNCRNHKHLYSQCLFKKTVCPNDEKVSFHIIIRNGYKFSNMEHCKEFMEDFMFFISENNFPVKFDKAIYTKNRNIRLLNNHKRFQPERVAVRYKDNKGLDDKFYCASYLTGDEEVVYSSKFTENPQTEDHGDKEMFICDGTYISKLVGLICEKIDEKEHSLCDTEVPNKLCYANWIKLMFAVLNSCPDSYDLYKKLFYYYRNADEKELGSRWVNIEAYRGKYNWTVNSLKYWARENDRYYKEFPEEELEDDIAKMEYKYNHCMDKMFHTFKESDEIKYINQIGRLSSMIVDDVYIEKVFNGVIKNVCNGGQNLLFVKKIIHCEVTKKDCETWGCTSFQNLTKPSGMACIKAKIMNYNFLDDLEEYKVRMLKKEKKVDKPSIYHVVNTKDILIRMFESGKIDTYNNIVYKPFLYRPEESDNIDFNLFTEFPHFNALSDGTTSERYNNSLLKNHLFETLCGGEHIVYEYVDNYIAHMLQKPNERPDVAILFSGAPGTGKDMWMKTLTSMLGVQNTLTLGSMNHLLGSFNKEQEGKLLTCINEISDKGIHFDKSDQLKHQITQDTVRVEPKGLDAYQINHRSRYFGFTNKENVLKVETGERRFLMIKTENKYANNHSYFKPLWEEIDDIEFIKSMFYYYATKDITNFIVRELPETEYKKEQKLLNLPNALQFLLDSCKDENELFQNESSIKIHSQDLYQNFINWCVESGVNSCAKKNFKNVLQSFGLDEYDKKIKIDGKVRVGYKLEKESLLEMFRSYLNQDTFDF